jgi:hypothetical protein
MSAGMGAARRFFADRWRGDVPIARLFWRDMVVVGSLVNAAATLAALAVLAAGQPAWLSVAVFAAPLPYNLFLVFSVWRTAARTSKWASAYQVAAALWLILALIL